MSHTRPLPALPELQNKLARLAIDTRSLAGRTDYRKFVIVGVARTGSTLLLNLLNSHSQTLSFGEVFRSPNTIGWDVEPFVGQQGAQLLAFYRSDPLAFLQKHIYRRWPRSICAVGFKLFYYHAREHPFTAVWDYLQSDPSIDVIHIKRRNILEQYLSLRLAHATDVWSTTRAVDAAPDAIRLEPEACLEHFRTVRAQETACDAFFDGRRIMTVDYEDLTAERTAAMNALQEFLGVRREAVGARIVRQRTEPMSRAIANYDEIATYFSGTEWSSFFTTPGVAAEFRELRRRMAAEYQETDFQVVDYSPFQLDEAILDRSTTRPLWIRGPNPDLRPGEYFVCLGSAQTFGRFCTRPFPTILEEQLSLPVLNISHGGAGPAFFCGDNERLLEYINAARFVVVQVMSGRSDGNSLFECDGVGFYKRRSNGALLSCDEAYEQLIRTEPRSVVSRVVQETRQSWTASYDRLLSAIKVPKVLFWFATRRPAYRQGWRSVPELFGAYPQLVNEEMVAALRRRGDFYAACTSKRGLPQTLRDRVTGEAITITDPWTAQPWTTNWYYPSPEMHVDAAQALEPVCRKAAGMAGPKLDAFTALRRRLRVSA